MCPICHWSLCDPTEQEYCPHLVQGCDHDALALDLALPKAHKLVPVGEEIHHSLADMNTHGEAVALHAAGGVDSVAKEAVAGALHAYHPSICSATVHT